MADVIKQLDLHPDELSLRELRNNNNNNYKKITDNFEQLNGDFNNAVDTVSNKAFSQVVDSAKIEWLPPVDTFSLLDTTYPDAIEGKTSMARDSGKVYRKTGSAWTEIQQIDAGPVNEVDSRLTSQLAQKAQRLDSEIVNTKYPPKPLVGMKGDNTTDDTIAFQNIINYSFQQKKTVFVPDGTYKITGTITLPGNAIKIIGSEIERTVFMFSGNSYFMDITGVYGYYLENFSVSNVNVIDQTTCFKLDQAIMGYMKNIHTRDFYTHIDVIKNSWINRFYNVYMSYGNIGIRFGHNTNQFVLEQCAIRHMENTGVWVEHCNGLTLSNTDLEASKTGVLVKRNTLAKAEVFNLNIDGCYTEMNLNGFLRVDGAGIKGRINLSNNFVSTGHYQGTDVVPHVVVTTGLSGSDTIEILSENNVARYNASATSLFNVGANSRVISMNDWSESDIPYYTGTGSFTRFRSAYGTLDIDTQTGSTSGKVTVNGFILNALGATSTRPTSPKTGQMYYDTELKKPIWWRATTWLDSDGNPA